MSEILASRLAPMTAATRRMATERIADLFDRYHPRLYRLARRLLSDSEEARDLVQEAFLRAARKPAALPSSDDSAEAWLVRVVVNLCRDRHRRLAVRRRPETAIRLAPLESSSPESRTLARLAVQDALARLHPRRRAVVVLRELEELPVAEVARLLGMNPGTVRWHHSRARRDLARWLGVPAAAPDRQTDAHPTR